MFESHERSEYSYIWVLVIVFGVAIFIVFSFFPLLNGRQAPLSTSKSVKVAKNVIDFLFQK